MNNLCKHSGSHRPSQPASMLLSPPTNPSDNGDSSMGLAQLLIPGRLTFTLCLPLGSISSY